MSRALARPSARGSRAKLGGVRFGQLVSAVALGVAVLSSSAGAASAHVTVSPSTLAAGTGDAVLTFRVPNESATANVVGLRIEFPLDHPIVLLSPEAGSGWQVTVDRATLPKPITTDDGTFTSTVSEIDWSGGTIAVGQFGQFNVLAQGIPTGTSSLVFKAVQTYSDGSSASWIQVPNKAVPDPDHPAPIIQLTTPGKASAAPQATGQAATGTGETTSTSTGTNALAVASLILACFAVLLGLIAVWLGRPKQLGPGLPSDAPPDPVASRTESSSGVRSS